MGNHFPLKKDRMLDQQGGMAHGRSTQQTYDSEGRPLDGQGKPLPPSQLDSQGRPFAAHRTDKHGTPLNSAVDAQGQPMTGIHGQRQQLDAQGLPMQQSNVRGQQLDAQGLPMQQSDVRGRQLDAQGQPMQSDVRGQQLDDRGRPIDTHTSGQKGHQHGSHDISKQTPVTEHHASKEDYHTAQGKQAERVADNAAGDTYGHSRAREEEHGAKGDAAFHRKEKNKSVARDPAETKGERIKSALKVPGDAVKEGVHAVAEKFHERKNP